MSSDYEYQVSIDFDIQRSVREEESMAVDIQTWCQSHCSGEWACSFIFSNTRSLASVQMGFMDEMDACLFKLSF